MTRNEKQPFVSIVCVLLYNSHDTIILGTKLTTKISQQFNFSKIRIIWSLNYLAAHNILIRREDVKVESFSTKVMNI